MRGSARARPKQRHAQTRPQNALKLARSLAAARTHVKREASLLFLADAGVDAHLDTVGVRALDVVVLADDERHQVGGHDGRTLVGDHLVARVATVRFARLLRLSRVNTTHARA